ncbi:hypothetical protein PM082_004496 [Marasmius tenuissimus]|nr:hypothetical protein PM082_004496 [Marasmius tenuissimus]
MVKASWEGSSTVPFRVIRHGVGRVTSLTEILNSTNPLETLDMPKIFGDFAGARGLWAKIFRLNEDLFSADWLGTRDTAVHDPISVVNSLLITGVPGSQAHYRTCSNMVPLNDREETRQQFLGFC